MNNANELTKKTCNASFRKLCCRFFVMLLLLFFHLHFVITLTGNFSYQVIIVTPPNLLTSVAPVPPGITAGVKVQKSIRLGKILGTFVPLDTTALSTAVPLPHAREVCL